MFFAAGQQPGLQIMKQFSPGFLKVLLVHVTNINVVGIDALHW